MGVNEQQIDDGTAVTDTLYIFNYDTLIVTNYDTPNLGILGLEFNRLTGEIPPEVCDLIESNNLDMNNILPGNNLINTCD